MGRLKSRSASTEMQGLCCQLIKQEQNRPQPLLRPYSHMKSNFTSATSLDAEFGHVIATGAGAKALVKDPELLHQLKQKTFKFETDDND